MTYLMCSDNKRLIAKETFELQRNLRINYALSTLNALKACFLFLINPTQVTEI